MSMKSDVQKQSAELAEVLGNLGPFHAQIEEVVEQLREAYAQGRTVYIAGNGGSAAQAQHFSDEMVGRYKADRPPYPAMALTADGAVLTCIGNDYGFEHVFARQIEALGKEGDIFIGLSTSGASKNVLLAAEQARKQGMTVIALTGSKGKLRDVADFAITVPSSTTARIQEMHLHAIHLICEAFESPGAARSRLDPNGTTALV